MNNNHQDNSIEPYEKIVYAYTRAQAIADGFQIDVTATAKEAGICFPVFITRGVYELCVAVPPGVKDGRCGSHRARQSLHGSRPRSTALV